MPAELLGDRAEGFEMTYEEWVTLQVGPRAVGGRYDHGDPAGAYEVLAIDRGPRPSWPTWQITVRYDRDGREATHCTGWDSARDRVLVRPVVRSANNDFDGRLTEGSVVLTQDPEGSGWAARCTSTGCAWADSCGPLGFQGLRALARRHTHDG